jgi:hypothetical protein
MHFYFATTILLILNPALRPMMPTFGNPLVAQANQNNNPEYIANNKSTTPSIFVAA